NLGWKVRAAESAAMLQALVLALCTRLLLAAASGCSALQAVKALAETTTQALRVGKTDALGVGGESQLGYQLALATEGALEATSFLTALSCRMDHFPADAASVLDPAASSLQQSWTSLSDLQVEKRSNKEAFEQGLNYTRAIRFHVDRVVQPMALVLQEFESRMQTVQLAAAGGVIGGVSCGLAGILGSVPSWGFCAAGNALSAFWSGQTWRLHANLAKTATSLRSSLQELE
ncbi:unnamed protein product, partial [Symbiodinium microadriaticum]